MTTAKIFQLRPPSKPRPVLHVPTSDRIVKLWAVWAAKNIAAKMRPLPQNLRARDDARDKYIIAVWREQSPT